MFKHSDELEFTHDYRRETLRIGILFSDGIFEIVKFHEYFYPKLILKFAETNQ